MVENGVVPIYLNAVMFKRRERNAIHCCSKNETGNFIFASWKKLRCCILVSASETQLLWFLSFEREKLMVAWNDVENRVQREKLLGGLCFEFVAKLSRKPKRLSTRKRKLKLLAKPSLKTVFSRNIWKRDSLLLDKWKRQFSGIVKKTQMSFPFLKRNGCDFLNVQNSCSREMM